LRRDGLGNQFCGETVARVAYDAATEGIILQKKDRALLPDTPQRAVKSPDR